MHKQIIKNNWKEIKGEIIKAWGSLTEADLDKSNGNLKAVSKLVQKNYGQNEQEIKRKLHHILETFDRPNTARIRYGVIVRDLRVWSGH